MTKQNTDSGFSIIEVLLILVVVGILGFTGWYVYHAKQASDKDYSANYSTVPAYKKKTTTTASQYAGWNSYTTKYDKLSFKYPSSWKLVDQSNTDSTDVTPGSDGIELISNDGLEVSIGTGGTTFTGGGPQDATAPAEVLASVPVKMLGGTYYLNFTSNNATKTTSGSLLSMTAAWPTIYTLPLSKHITLSSTAVPGLPKPFDLIGLDYNDLSTKSNNYQPQDHTIAEFQQDPNYKTGLLILESVAY